jgi:2-polyprenyl-3-methyl-5-hydroxy-6-metoxy-1,4-benzoquinol methylase
MTESQARHGSCVVNLVREPWRQVVMAMLRSFALRACSVRERVSNAYKRAVSSVKPYQPMDGGRELLDRQYATGVWDYLRGLEELSRFSVIAGYCHYLKNQGSILEIGCGEGLLPERFDGAKYSRYVGVDISAEAVRRAAARENAKTSFITADAAVYVTAERFDVIVFNECLEYFSDPLSVVRRYEPFLREHGIFIVSMFVGLDTARTSRIWRSLGAVYTPRAVTRVTNEDRYTWIIKVFSPLAEMNRRTAA